MSPILVRPVREQLEHDRVIRLLQAKYKRKFEVAINPGNTQAMPVGPGPAPWYPDLVLQSQDRTRKLAGIVEVETAESVNNLEAMSQWATFARLRVPFHLYLPTGCIDTARRFCAELNIPVAELWAYQTVGDQLRFTLVHKEAPAAAPKAKAAASANGRTAPASRAATTPTPEPSPAAPPRRPRARPERRAARPAAAPPARRATKTKAAPARRPAAKAPAARAKAKAAPRAQKRR